MGRESIAHQVAGNTTCESNIALIVRDESSASKIVSGPQVDARSTKTHVRAIVTVFALLKDDNCTLSYLMPYPEENQFSRSRPRPCHAGIISSAPHKSLVCCSSPPLPPPLIPIYSRPTCLYMLWRRHGRSVVQIVRAYQTYGR